jgi:hypothetical protein
MEHFNDSSLEDTLQLESELIQLAKETISQSGHYPPLSDDREEAFQQVLEREQVIIDKSKEKIGEL